MSKRGGNVVPEITREEHQEDLIAKRVTDVGSNHQTKVEYDGSDNPIYLGQGAKGLATSDDGWLIKKLTWSSDNLITIQSAIGSWDGRASLTYE